MQQTLICYNTHDGQRGRILEMLRTHDFVPTASLRLFAYQYNARIFELRKAGHDIESCRQDGVVGFRLCR